MKTYSFEVIGVGSFPLDMLRYDSCWPATSEDVGKVLESVIEMKGIGMDNRFENTVKLTGINPPTVDRWKSFMWVVVR